MLWVSCSYSEVHACNQHTWSFYILSYYRIAFSSPFFQEIMEPFHYISQVPGKDFRGKLIDAFQVHYNISSCGVYSVYLVLFEKDARVSLTFVECLPGTCMLRS